MLLYMNNNTNKAAAWDAGYKAGRNAGGSKGIPTNPYENTDAEQAFNEGYGIGLDDAWKCAKTGRALENPYN